jgi:hypothetical protein
LAVNLLQANSIRPDKEILQREFLLTINLLRHSCQRGLFGLHVPRYSKRFLADELESIITEFKEIWLIRNHPGGLIDSLTYFDVAMRDYV